MKELKQRGLLELWSKYKGKDYSPILVELEELDKRIKGLKKDIMKYGMTGNALLNKNIRQNLLEKIDKWLAVKQKQEENK